MTISAKNIERIGYDFVKSEIVLYFFKAEIIDNINKKEYRFRADYKTFVEYAKKIIK